MTPEGKLAKQIKDYLDGLKAKHELWWFKIHGGPMQLAGVPDNLVIIHGVPLFLEPKAKGNKPTKLQLHTMGQIREAGATCRVVYTLDETKDAVNQIMALPAPDTSDLTAEIGKGKS